MNVNVSLHERPAFKLSESGQPVIALQVQRPHDEPRADVVFVHGATFGADLSVYSRSMDALGRTPWLRMGSPSGDSTSWGMAIPTAIRARVSGRRARWTMRSGSCTEW